MSLEIRDLIEKRNRAATQAREFLDKASTEKRDLSEDENKQIESWLTEAEKHRKDIDQRQRLAAVEVATTAMVTEAEKVTASGDELAQRQFINMLQKRDIFHGFGATEKRDVLISNDEKGGYWVPSLFQETIRKVMDASTFMTKICTVTMGVPPEADMGIPTLDTDPADFDWTSEVASATADTTMAAGKRTLKTNLSSKLIKVSMAMLQRRPEVASFIIDRLTYKQAVTLEKAALTATGAGRPLGVFTANSAGVSTARDVSTGNTSTAITADGLINAKFGMRPVYFGRSAWIGHTDFVKAAALLKDGENRYMFALATQPNIPDQLLGRPVYVSEFAPNTFTTGLYVGIIGDFTQYEIASSNMSVQRLDEKYADTNQVGFIGRQWADGMPVFGEAFARVTLT